MKKQLFCVMCLCIMFVGTMVAADENPKIVRARIGIELRQGEETRPARVRDRVAVGDRFRVYAIPEPDPGYIYVVYADHETAMQLNEAEQIETPKDKVLTLPSLDELYEIDNSSPRFTVTIVCSAEKLPELKPLLDQEDIPSSQWKKIEDTLVTRSKIELAQVAEKPWPLAGTVRGDDDDNDFLQQLKISSGKSLVVKRYEFRLQK